MKEMNTSKALRPLIERGILAALEAGDLGSVLSKTRDSFLLACADQTEAMVSYEKAMDDVLSAGHLSVEVACQVRSLMAPPSATDVRVESVRKAEMLAFMLGSRLGATSGAFVFNLQRSAVDPTVIYIISMAGRNPVSDRHINVMGKIKPADVGDDNYQYPPTSSKLLSASGSSVILKNLPKRKLVKCLSHDDPSTDMTYWTWAVRPDEGDELKLWMSIRLDARLDAEEIECNGGRAWLEKSSLRAVFMRNAPTGYRII